MVCAEGEEGGLYSGEWRVDSGQFFHRMENRGGVVHHAEGIYRGAELFFFESRANVISKARPYEEHFLAWFYLEPWLLNIYNRPKLHLLILNSKLTTAYL